MLSRTITSPVGPLRITVDDGFVIGLEFSEERVSVQEDCLKGHRDFHLLRRAISEIGEYFQGRRRRFTVPVNLSGPPFHQKVWKVLQEIDYGDTNTYGEVALAAGSPRAARAVGNACAANPVAIIVPCHRVVAHNGLGGFGGGLDIKGWLLRFEKKDGK